VSLVSEELEREVGMLVLRMLKLQPGLASELRRADIEQWDSLKHMEIIFALEDRYGVQFDESEFLSLDSPAAIALALRRHLAP